MSIVPPESPAEGFATIVRWLVHTLVTQGLCGRLAAPLIWPILDRIRTINQRFKRLAARLAAGTYVPRRHAARRHAAAGPRRRNPLPQGFGWLLKLVPEVVGYRAQLEHHLRNPDMAALIAQAPASMGRILRPLCWMLYLPPPPILARPRRAPAPVPEAALAPEAAPAPEAGPAPAAAPRPRRPTPSRLPPARPVPARACGPPRPA